MVTIDETRHLLRLIASVAPGQKVPQDAEGLTEMSAVWQGILGGARYPDALEAVRRIASRQPFIAPAEIIQEVRRIRRDRLARAELVEPNVDPDNVPAYLAERRAILAAVADGTFDVDAYTGGGLTLTGAPAKAITAGPEVANPEVLGRLVALRERMRVDVSVFAVAVTDPVVDQVAAERMERERAAQLEALAALEDPEVPR